VAPATKLARPGYALDFVSVVVHVAAELESAGPAALSVNAIAARWTPVVTTDLHRVQVNEGVLGDAAAKIWLVLRALREFGDQIEWLADGRDVRLAVPRNELRWRNEPVPRQDAPLVLRDPFNPMSGQFAENVRKLSGKDQMTELRESMRAFGWLDWLPAIEDERGVTIVGHRRKSVAAELGIEPVIRKVEFGRGDAGDAERLKLAIASNIGQKPFTPEERQRIAKYLYGERGWGLERIAQALQVSKTTIGRDLEGFPTVGKPDRPKGGRPKRPAGAAKKARNVAEKVIHQGMTPRQAAAEEGYRSTNAEKVVDRGKAVLYDEMIAAREASPSRHCQTCTCFA